ncbi:MAG: pyruvate kinase [Nitrospiraceae bacterium]
MTPVTTASQKTEFDSLKEKLTRLFLTIQRKAAQGRTRYHFSSPDAQCSCDNLLAYLALREHDLQDLQLELAECGLSSLGRLEGSVLHSLRMVLQHLGVAAEGDHMMVPEFEQARSLLARRSTLLLGRPRPQHQTRIMVTLEPDLIRRPDLIEQLLLQGMDIARVNCAHDTSQEWGMLIQAVRDAEERLASRRQSVGRRCRIFMDLAGPKVRTGPLTPMTRPLKLAVEKDAYGRPSRILEGFLDVEATHTRRISLPAVPRTFVIALPGQGSLATLALGEELRFTDTRGRLRTFHVLERVSPTKIRVGLERTAYVEEGTELLTAAGTSFRIGPIMPQPADIRVQAGDRIYLYRDPTRLGHGASEGRSAGIGCTLPAVLEMVKPGHRICIDDGKITTVVRKLNPEYVELEVATPHDVPARVRSEKGLNFPDSAIDGPAFTPQDREDLRFVVDHATAVGLSFVHCAQDLVDLQKALQELGRPDFGIVIKIETRKAIHRLAQLLLVGLDLPKFGVMIARGDLAVEVGFEHLALVQEDILCLCEAAHVPVIWATQVLESMAKSGLPARAEITDAATGQRAECVMLNKGRFVLDAVKILADLLGSRERQRIKKRQVFRDITAQHGIFDSPGDGLPTAAEPVGEKERRSSDG